MSATAPGPAVSFVVPCYRDGHFLPECIGSILRQSFQDFEVLIMDDCSPDDTPAIARTFTDPRVRHVRNERNLGHLANYNKGIGLARGLYVWLINVDDYLARSYTLERFVEALNGAPAAAFVFCRGMTVRDGVEQPLHVLHGDRDAVFHGRTFVEDLVVRNTISTPSVMVRRSSYERVGLFPPDLPHAGDWYQWCRHALHGDVAYLAEPLVCYRLHGDSMSARLHEDRPRRIIDDEIEVRWRIRAWAEANGDASLVAAATAAIARDYGLRVGLYLTERWRLGLTVDEFEASLYAHTRDAATRLRIRAEVLRRVGDYFYSHGQPTSAAQFYRQALAAAPADLRTWAKRGLLAAGPAGRTMRRAAARLRQRPPALA